MEQPEVDRAGDSQQHSKRIPSTAGAEEREIEEASVLHLVVCHGLSEILLLHGDIPAAGLIPYAEDSDGGIDSEAFCFQPGSPIFFLQ